MVKKAIASSPPEKLVERSVAAMRPPLTEKQRKEVEALIAKPDSEIDFSDQPETLGPYRPVKRAINLRLDADVLAWLQFKPGYQTRINGLLREAMTRQSK